MEKKIGFREIVFVASMFFGMLFGAGNLIFPVSMGQKAGMETLLASLGFCITGVGLPLLSVVAMAVSKIFLLFYNPALPLYWSSFCYPENGHRTVSGGDGTLFA